MLIDYVRGESATNLGWPQEQLDRLRDAYVSVLDRDDWREVVHRAFQYQACSAIATVMHGSECRPPGPTRRRLFAS
jgi:hypothetical protein